MNLSDLKKYREAKGLSQQELAELIGVRRQTIASFENGANNRTWNIGTVAEIF